MTGKLPKRIAAARSTARSSLKERFERFMLLDGFAEDIDALVVASHVPGRRKADYLAFNRAVIIEQKSIDHDVDAKVSAVLDDLVREHGALDGLISRRIGGFRLR
jgi:hypothetical protein